MAPEVGMEEPYNELCDVYSFGVLFWEMMTLSKPYGKSDMVDLIENVWKADETAKRPKPSLLEKGQFIFGRGIKGVLNRRKEKKQFLRGSTAPTLGSPASLQMLLEGCWSYELEKRPSMSQVEDRLREEVMSFRNFHVEIEDSRLVLQGRRRSTFVYEEGEQEQQQ
jgi:serine/threonine protein kinase